MGDPPGSTQRGARQRVSFSPSTTVPGATVAR